MSLYILKVPIFEFHTKVFNVGRQVPQCYDFLLTVALTDHVYRNHASNILFVAANLSQHSLKRIASFFTRRLYREAVNLQAFAGL